MKVFTMRITARRLVLLAVLCAVSCFAYQRLQASRTHADEAAFASLIKDYRYIRAILTKVCETSI